MLTVVSATLIVSERDNVEIHVRLQNAWIRSTVMLRRVNFLFVNQLCFVLSNLSRSSDNATGSTGAFNAYGFACDSGVLILNLSVHT